MWSVHLGCVLLDCNGTKCTGNALSIPAAAFLQQLLRESYFKQVAIYLLVWPFHPMIWMCLCQIWLQTMLWHTCRDFQVDFDDSLWETVRYEQILINLWLPCTVNVQHSVCLFTPWYKCVCDRFDSRQCCDSHARIFKWILMILFEKLWDMNKSWLTYGSHAWLTCSIQCGNLD